VALTTHHI